MGSVLFSQEVAPEGSYSIELKSEKQAGNIELTEEILIDIESVRQQSSDTTIHINNMPVLIMSRKNLEKGVKWPKYKMKSRK